MNDKYSELSHGLARVFLTETSAEEVASIMQKYFGRKWTARAIGRLGAVRVHFAESKLSAPDAETSVMMQDEQQKIKRLFMLKLHSVDLDKLIQRTAAQPDSSRKVQITGRLQDQAQILNGDIKRLITQIENDARKLNQVMQRMRNERLAAERARREAEADAGFDSQLKDEIDSAIERVETALQGQ